MTQIDCACNHHNIFAPLLMQQVKNEFFSLKMKFVKWKFDNFWENFKLTRSIETNEFLFESFDWRILISRLFVGQKKDWFRKKHSSWSIFLRKLPFLLVIKRPLIGQKFDYIYNPQTILVEKWWFLKQKYSNDKIFWLSFWPIRNLEVKICYSAILIVKTVIFGAKIGGEHKVQEGLYWGTPIFHKRS